MAEFFIPFVPSKASAEHVYQTFYAQCRRRHPPVVSSGRLSGIGFEISDTQYSASVGTEIVNWSAEIAGLVFAIIETEQLTYIFSHFRGVLTANPIEIPSANLLTRRYFDESVSM